MMPSMPDPGTRIKWIEEAMQARANPGEWFFLTERDTYDATWSFAHQIVIGRKAAFRPAGSFEAVARDRKVIIRFVGEA